MNIENCDNCGDNYPVKPPFPPVPGQIPGLPDPKYYPHHREKRANYNTNTSGYYDYLGRYNEYLFWLEWVVNRLLRRNFEVEDTKSIDLTKIGDWIDNGKCPPCNFDDSITLKADVILSKAVETREIPSLGKSYDVTNGTEVKDDGVWSPDYINLITGIGEGKENKVYPGRLIDVSRETAKTTIGTRAELPIKTDTPEVFTITKNEEAEETTISVNFDGLSTSYPVVVAGQKTRVIESEQDGHKVYKVETTNWAVPSICDFEIAFRQADGSISLNIGKLIVGGHGAYLDPDGELENLNFSLTFVNSNTIIDGNTQGDMGMWQDLDYNQGWVTATLDMTKVTIKDEDKNGDWIFRLNHGDIVIPNLYWVRKGKVADITPKTIK